MGARPSSWFSRSRPSRPRPPGPRGASGRAAARRMRETCIWETPTCFGDLALGHVLDEAQMKDMAVALGDLLEHRRDRGAVLDGVEGWVLLADPVSQRRGLVSVADGRGRIEGHRMMTLRRMHRLQHLLLGGLDPLGDLAHRRRVPELGGQLGVCPLDPEDPFLDVARHVHRPAPVAEVALELTENGGHGEGREGGAALRVEAVYRLDQSRRSPLGPGRRRAPRLPHNAPPAAGRAA